jgi:hypothetical protein
MKRLRRNRKPWYVPPPPPARAVFQCRRCHAALTGLLALVTDPAALGQRAGASLVPEGHYWPVATGQDFAGHFAVALADLVGVGYHADPRRMIGCCGPSGIAGPNRVCACGQEVGTERSDCIWPQAVYLDPSQVRAMTPDAT